MGLRFSVILAATALAATPSLAQDDFMMTPTVKGVYFCEGADIGKNPAKFGLLEFGAFRLEDKEGDLLMYDFGSGTLQLGMAGASPMRLRRTGPEEYRYMGEGDAVRETICKLMPGKNPETPPW